MKARKALDAAQIDFLAPDYTTETPTGHDVFREAPAADPVSRLIPRLIPVDARDYTERAEQLSAGADRLNAKLDAIADAIDALKKGGTP